MATALHEMKPRNIGSGRNEKPSVHDRDVCAKLAETYSC